MSILKIARMGHPVLGRPAETVADPTAPEVARLVDDMLATLDDIGGFGLAAPQVHVAQRVVVFHLPAERLDDDDGLDRPVEMTVLINPVIEPIGEEIEFVMKVTVTNLGPATLTDLLAKDPLPGDLQLDDNDTCNDTFAVHSGDGTVGTVTTTSKGRTKKCFVFWNIGDLTTGQIAMLTITVSTDENPGVDGRPNGEP